MTPETENIPTATSHLQPSTDIPYDDIKNDKTYRKGLDEILQSLKSEPPSRERALAITKIQEAIMWLGMDLKRLGTPTPYPNSYDPTSPVVDPTADGLNL